MCERERLCVCVCVWCVCCMCVCMHVHMHVVHAHIVHAHVRAFAYGFACARIQVYAICIRCMQHVFKEGGVLHVRVYAHVYANMYHVFAICIHGGKSGVRKRGGRGGGRE